jgi:hypothetical protein
MSRQYRVLKGQRSQAMKIISIWRHLSTVPHASDEVERQAEWMRDPLSHPDIDAMSERQLADLPFGRTRIVERCCPA